MSGTGKTLVLGWGNPARGDDGLGPALVERISRANLPGVEARAGYQLRVEDAMVIGGYQRVVFVDASREAAAPFEYRPLNAADALALDSHGVSPAALVRLARTLFGAKTRAELLAVRGYRFEPFAEHLSRAARANLDRACAFVIANLAGLDEENTHGERIDERK